MGADWIGVEDVAGILAPASARSLVAALVKGCSLPVSIHTHSTTGFAPITYFTAIEAGATGVDTALSALAWGASQPATETIVAALKGGSHDTGLDIGRISQASRYVNEIHDEYLEFQDPIAFSNDVDVLEHQLPTPVLAVVIRTLRERHAIDRYDRLIAELIQVRKDMGYPPMAAPINRIAAQQALSNTLSEKRYQQIEQPFRDYVKGLFGAPPAPIDSQVRKRVLGSSEAITMRPADLLEPGLDRARREMRKLGLSPPGTDPVLTYILFPEDAPGIMRPPLRSLESAATPAPTPAPPAAGQPGPASASAHSAEPSAPAPPSAREFTVEVDGEPYQVRIIGDGIIAAAPMPARAPGGSATPPSTPGGNGAIQAPMQGMVVRDESGKGIGARLADVLACSKPRKMKNELVATVAGTVREVFAKEGSIVAPNEVLMTIG